MTNGKDSGIYKCVASVGYNPHFGDLSQKTIEPWILHDFAEDFYGSELKLIMCCRIRSECKFDSLEELIQAIKDDGTFSEEALEAAEFNGFKDDEFLTSPKL